jgi:glutamyl-tRNA reductase
MTGLNHKSAGLEIREKFALTKEGVPQILAAIKDGGIVGGCVILSTCNRTELYASVADGGAFAPTEALCGALGREYAEFERFFSEKSDERAIEHLCKMAAGLDSQILGDDQIITQAREALEISRGNGCADSYVETAFNVAISAAKMIKTNVIMKTVGSDSVPGKAIEKLKTICRLAGMSAVVVGNGLIGRLVAELLIRENARVTVALRRHKKGIIRVPDGTDTIDYGERYKAVEQADIVISATASPNFTLCRDEFDKLTRLPKIIVDLAVPRDVEPSVQDIPGITLLTISDLSGEGRVLPPESVRKVEEIVAAHIAKYNRWLVFKQKAASENSKIKACDRDGSGVYTR